MWQRKADSRYRRRFLSTTPARSTPQRPLCISPHDLGLLVLTSSRRHLLLRLVWLPRLSVFLMRTISLIGSLILFKVMISIVTQRKVSMLTTMHVSSTLQVYITRADTLPPHLHPTMHLSVERTRHPSNISIGHLINSTLGERVNVTRLANFSICPEPNPSNHQKSSTAIVITSQWA